MKSKHRSIFEKLSNQLSIPTMFRSFSYISFSTRSFSFKKSSSCWPPSNRARTHALHISHIAGRLNTEITRSWRHSELSPFTCGQEGSSVMFDYICLWRTKYKKTKKAQRRQTINCSTFRLYRECWIWVLNPFKQEIVSHIFKTS